jgi:hypothetical protein
LRRSPAFVTVALLKQFNGEKDGIVASNPLAEIRNIRIGKAQSMRDLGLKSFSFQKRPHALRGDLVSKFEEHNGKDVTIAGA